jgi:kynurenine formamidase
MGWLKSPAPFSPDMEIIDLSQEIYAGMPVFEGHPGVEMTVAVTHEQRNNTVNPRTVSPVLHALTLSEHAGTHVDAFSHFGIEFRGKSIDTMPLKMFYTEGICVDVSHRGPGELIEVRDIRAALSRAGLEIRAGDTVLLYTDHYRNCFGTPDWPNGPGISVKLAEWFGKLGISAFGVETRSPGIVGVSNKEVHRIGGELGYSHYENLINLHRLLAAGRFRFIALPLKIRGGTGSPVRAVAVLED